MWLTISLVIFILGLGTVIGFLIKALIVQVRKNTIHEQWIVDLQTKVENIHENITILDDKQMFSKDDEVGSVFQDIVDLIKSLNEITTRK
jgi:predicted translin family RNA/ssDNA-binding protein